MHWAGAAMALYRKAIPMQSECVTHTPHSIADTVGPFVEEMDCHLCSVARSVPSLSRRCRAVHEQEAHPTGISARGPTLPNFCFFSPPTFTRHLYNTVKEQINHSHSGPVSHLWRRPQGAAEAPRGSRATTEKTSPAALPSPVSPRPGGQQGLLTLLASSFSFMFPSANHSGMSLL